MLLQFRAIVKELRFSPNSNAEFVKICKEKGCNKPYSIERDVCTRWNSTNSQLKSIIRCEAAMWVSFPFSAFILGWSLWLHYQRLEWQRLKRYGVDRKFHVDESKFCLARDLVQVLNIFHEITLQLSVSGSAQLANIVVFIDQITKHLSTTIKNNKFPPALRKACQIELKITNKYYSLTDSSPLYQIAICECLLFSLFNKLLLTFFLVHSYTPCFGTSTSNWLTGSLIGLPRLYGLHGTCGFHIKSQNHYL
jgi:hypothetical protein